MKTQKSFFANLIDAKILPRTMSTKKASFSIKKRRLLKLKYYLLLVIIYNQRFSRSPLTSFNH